MALNHSTLLNLKDRIERVIDVIAVRHISIVYKNLKDRIESNWTLTPSDQI